MLKGYKQTEEAKQKNREAHLGKVNSPETRKKISEANKGKKKPPRSLQWRRRQSKSRIGIPLFHRRGAAHHWWRGGISVLNNVIRRSLEYKNWRRSVFERDGYKCTKCGDKNSDLNAHHLKSFSDYPELRFEISNGITLCENCHFEEHHKSKV